MPQKVKFLGKKKIKINDKIITHYISFLSNDDKPFEKKLNIHIWYDENTMLWLKSSYEKIWLLGIQT